MNLGNTEFRQSDVFDNGRGDTVVLTNFFDYELSGDFISYDKRQFTDSTGCSTLIRVHNAAITKVVYNDPAVVVFWNDGTKTVARCHNENYDREKGLYVAVLKKIMGNEGFRTFSKDWTVDEEQMKMFPDKQQFVTLKDVRKKHK